MGKTGDDVLTAHHIDDGQDDNRKQPADRIGCHEGRKIRLSGKGRIEPDDSDSANPDEGDDGRRQRIAVTAKGTGQDVDHTVQVKRTENEEQSRRPQGHDSRIVIEQADEFR